MVYYSGRSKVSAMIMQWNNKAIPRGVSYLKKLVSLEDIRSGEEGFFSHRLVPHGRAPLQGNRRAKDDELAENDFGKKNREIKWKPTEEVEGNAVYLKEYDGDVSYQQDAFPLNTIDLKKDLSVSKHSDCSRLMGIYNV
ncbi:hypothetical protein CEXT_49861 [Caerostris extrusa]|uniref:Uncharacterized protein n=1 Tax=Caerostris extrusa TaxID=172846 RepID=A0AAV4UKY3_CAEEX|nr:hypothetical protein CEXT_49861 [Caerostris extrusa]